MSTIETNTVIRTGTWQRAVTPDGTDLGHDIAPVVDGTTTIGHLLRYATDDYRAVLQASRHGRTDAPVRCTSAFAALISVARRYHHI